VPSQYNSMVANKYDQLGGKMALHTRHIYMYENIPIDSLAIALQT